LAEFRYDQQEKLSQQEDGQSVQQTENTAIGVNTFGTGNLKHSKSSRKSQL
jgi:hypothetical protein